MAAPPPKDRLLSAFSVLSSATLLAIVFSVMTNKAIALFAGPEGIALMGLYRTMGAFVTGTIAMGFATIVVQRVSKARDQDEIDSVLGAASLLFFIQLAVVALAAAAAAEPLGRWLLDASFSGVTAAEVRVVLAMALVNLALGLVTAALNGQSNVRPITIVYLSTSLSSLLLIYPLIQLGRIGLAVNVASGGIVGVCLGLYFLRKIFRFSLCGPWSQKWAMLRGAASTSYWLIAQNMVIMGGLLALQKAIIRAHGLEALGGFNAALLIVDTIIMAIMSSARSYALPALGRLSEEGHKHELISRVLALRVVAATAASGFLIFAAKPVLTFLFSRKFSTAADSVAILSLSLVVLSYSWSYNSFLLHKSEMRLYVIIDMIWIAAMILAVKACGVLGLSLNSMAWSYTASCVLSAAMYALVCTRRYGRGLLSGENAMLGAGCFAWLLAALLVSHSPSFIHQGAFLCVSLAAAWTAGLGGRVNEWLQADRAMVQR